jgi:glycosyltransferase involved in cell wall biosynthesis
MRITYIIPTVGRSTISNTISSILAEDKNARIIVERNGTAGENRNKALLLEMTSTYIPTVSPDWIAFIDDDDFYNPGYLKEIDNEYDIIVMRMSQNGVNIPRDNNLRFGNVGINFMVKTSFLRNSLINNNVIELKSLFDNSHGEDWRFIEGLLKHNAKVKITDKVFYICSSVNHLLPPHLRTAPI